MPMDVNTISDIYIRSNSKSWNSSEFHQAIKASLAPCRVGALRSTSTSWHEDSIQIRARAYLTNYISGHNIAFTTAKGAATDLYTFIALVVSTAISVMLAVAGHFTNFLLKWICRLRPFHLDCERSGKTRKRAKVAFQVGCNVLLSTVSFLPLLSVAWTEAEREKPFHTWDIGSSDLFYDPFIQSAGQLRVLYLLSSTSNYNSHFLAAITTVVSITCFVVAVRTIWRCELIFTRYRVLQEYDELALTSSDIDDTKEAVATLRALKAIEMTEVEYMEMTKEMRRNAEDCPPYTPTPTGPTPPPASYNRSSSSHARRNRAYSLPAWPQRKQLTKFYSVPTREFEAQTSPLLYRP